MGFLFKHRAGLIALIAFGLAGCTSSNQIGFTRQTPDEFAVTTRKPLELPPDFTLVPPSAALPSEDGRPSIRQILQDDDGGEDLQGAVFITDEDSADALFLVELGVDQVLPDIRQTVNRESTELTLDRENFVDQIVFWQDTPEGDALDAAGEAQRIRQALDQDAPLTTGTSPIIRWRRQAPLEGLFRP
ncbi:MAG: DUF3035 domain-containing protein [Pseudomonadota bacterium]